MIKAVLVGDSEVGKTQFSNILTSQYVPDQTSTISTEFSIKNFNIQEKIVRLQLWDTPGQEIYIKILHILIMKELH